MILTGIYWRSAARARRFVNYAAPLVSPVFAIIAPVLAPFLTFFAALPVQRITKLAYALRNLVPNIILELKPLFRRPDEVG